MSEKESALSQFPLSALAVIPEHSSRAGLSPLGIHSEIHPDQPENKASWREVRSSVCWRDLRPPRWLGGP